VARLTKDGAPCAIATRVAGLDALFNVLDIVEVAAERKRDIESVARLHFELAGELDFPWMRAAIGRLRTETHWAARAKASLRDDLAGMLRGLTTDALRNEGKRNVVLYQRFRQVLADVRSAETPDLAMLSVALRELRNLVSR
jgi:glutamate dehydrogenase